MSTIRCPECRMVNWATALNCKRCAYFFQPVEASAAVETAGVQASFVTNVAPVTAVPDTFVEQTPAASTFVEQAPANTQYAPPNESRPAFEAPTSWTSSNSSNQNFGQNQQYNQNYNQNQNQNYNQNYNQNFNQGYQQPNYGQQNFRQQASHQKTGLAVTSMIFGILSVVTALFLIGILFAPVGLILGIVALVKAKRKPNQYGGKGFAIAGVATSALITLFMPIVLAIAIPNLLAARRIANEMSAAQTMYTIVDAEMSYRKGAGKGTCADINTLISSNLIEGALQKNEKNGYRFNVVNYPLGGCEVTATPVSTSDGDRSFYFSTDDNMMRSGKKNGKPADKTDQIFTPDTMKNEALGKSEKSGGVPNENAAIKSLKMLQGAQATYSATVGQGEIGSFADLAAQQLISPNLADGEDSGYRFNMHKTSNNNFELTATPISSGSGARSLFMSPIDGLRGGVKNGAPADKFDPPVDN